MDVKYLNSPKSPSDLKKNNGLGRFYEIPIAYWYEKGHFWSRRMRFSLERVVAKHGNSAMVCMYWGKPEVTIDNLGIKSAEQTKPCKCKECIDGRKLVKKGWMPA